MTVVMGSLGLAGWFFEFFSFFTLRFHLQVLCSKQFSINQHQMTTEITSLRSPLRSPLLSPIHHTTLRQGHMIRISNHASPIRFLNDSSFLNSRTIGVGFHTDRSERPDIRNLSFDQSTQQPKKNFPRAESKSLNNG